MINLCNSVFKHTHTHTQIYTHTHTHTTHTHTHTHIYIFRIIYIFRCSNRLSYQVMSSTRTPSQLRTVTPVSSFVQCHISFRLCLRQSACLFYSKFSWGNHMSVAESTDTCGMHHWRILWSSYRKLTWVGFEPKTAGFRSNALTDWAIRLLVQLTLRTNFVQLLQFHCLFSVSVVEGTGKYGIHH